MSINKAYPILKIPLFHKGDNIYPCYLYKFLKTRLNDSFDVGAGTKQSI